MSPLKRLSFVDLIIRRLQGRKDSEHIQATIRLVIAAIVAAYINSGLGTRDSFATLGDILSLVYFGISILILGWIIVNPEISHARRYFAMVCDHIFPSTGLLLEGARAGPLFPFYIWVTLGNGFRYGVRPLLWSTAISATCFLTVIFFSPFWQSMLPLSGGILLAMIAIPLYAASLIRQLRAAKVAAEQASHTKSRFLATASHELRTPLHAIIGLSELLQQTSLSSEQLEMVQTVRGSGRALLSLVEDVLDLSSIQAGRAVSSLQPFNLYDSIAETAAIARLQAARKGLSLAVRIAPDVPASLRGDWPHLRQILLNLITNAIKFTDSGQVTLTVEALEISHAEVRLSLTVSDTGIGIAQKDLDLIFETFGQANNSSTRKYGGVGLGLAIVRQLVDLMHGTVSVSSVMGHGSSFTVELPIAREANMAVPEKDSVLLLQSDDISLLSRLQATNAAIRIVSTVADIPADTDAVIVLIDVRNDSGDIDRISREIPALRFPSALIAFGTSLSSIQRDAPDVVCCFEDLDAATLSSAMLLGAALANHGELVSPLPEEKEFGILTAAKVDNALMRNGARVLVVEDSPVNRMVTQKILASAGYNVFLADGADQGLELLADEDFDLVLLDLNMPGTNGLDMIKLYKMMRLGQDLPPLVIFSADVTEEARSECLELGVSLFLPKPSEPSFMLQQLAALAPPRSPAKQEDTVAPEPVPVVEISSHPRYRATPEFGIVDRHALQSLASLDSDLSFLGDLIAEFEKDTVDLLAVIDQSVRDNDMHLFWDQLHAMRSSGANVGAKQIMIACAEITASGKMSFRTRGFEYAARLRYEFNRFSRTMDRFLLRQSKAAR